MDVLGYTLPQENMPWSPEKSISAMDQLGIDIAILSLPDGWVKAQSVNDRAAKLCKEYPNRFGFFACIPDLRKTDGKAFCLILRPKLLQ